MIRVQRQSRRAEEPIKGQDNYPKKPQMKRRKAKQPHYLANLFLTKQANGRIANLKRLQSMKNRTWKNKFQTILIE